MKIVFDPAFHQHYAGDPAAEPGRLEPAAELLGRHFDVVVPEPATTSDVALVHTDHHISRIEGNRALCSMALLAAGGAMTAAELAGRGEPAFALIRPPGHHASPDSCWGFCHFNNVAVAVEALLQDSRNDIDRALILDIDLHYGDGTAAFFARRPDVTYAHMDGATREDWLEECRETLEREQGFDIVAVSAGFDQHIDDWGELLLTEDYRTVGRWVRDATDSKQCKGRRFAVLEGGYDHNALAAAALALAEGME